MHVAHVAAFGNPMPGSFIPSIAALARALRARGHRFTYVNAHVPGAVWYDDLRNAGVELVVARDQREVYWALAGARPDVIHTHFSGFTVAASVAAAGHARLFWHLHTGRSACLTPLQTLRSRVRYAVLGRQVQRFVAVSRSLALQLAAWGADPGRTVVVGNAVDTARFRAPTIEERFERRARYGFRPDETVLAFFGRDTHTKGSDLLLEALRAEVPMTVLAIGLPQPMQDAFARHARLVAVDRLTDTRDAYWACDVMAMPSRVEGAPYTLLEATCCGVPTIASDIPAIRELAKDAPEVRLIPAEDAEALHEALCRFEPSRSGPVDPSVRERAGLDRWVREICALYE